MTVALIDGDIVAYRCAATVKEDDALDIGNWRASVMMDEIIADTGVSEYLLFLSGGENFRKTLYPLYKANRADKPRPRALQPVREYLVLDWNAKITDGIEADDALGIAQTEETIICSIDKDLLMIPGKHYNFVKKEFYEVSPTEALRVFYKQLLLGDRSDNVPGYDGLSRQKPTKIIQGWYNIIDNTDDELFMLEVVRQAYNFDDERLLLIGNLLYIQQKEGAKWQLPKKELLSKSTEQMAEGVTQ